MTDNTFSAEPAQEPAVAAASAETVDEATANSWENAADESSPSFVRGLVWAIILAILAGVLYILPVLLFGKVFIYLAILIGIAAAFGFTGFGDVKGFGVGLASAVVSALGVAVALLVEPAIQLTKTGGRNIFEALAETFANAPATIQTFIEGQGGLAWIVIGAAVLAGFYFASGLRSESAEA